MRRCLCHLLYCLSRGRKRQRALGLGHWQSRSQRIFGERHTAVTVCQDCLLFIRSPSIGHSHRGRKTQGCQKLHFFNTLGVGSVSPLHERCKTVCRLMRLRKTRSAFRARARRRSWHLSRDCRLCRKWGNPCPCKWATSGFLIAAALESECET